MFENADTETQNKIKYALIEQTLADTTDTSPVLCQKLFDASPDYLSVMELGLPRTPSTPWSHKRNRTTFETEDADFRAPTRRVKARKLINTPELAKQWERRNRSEFSPTNISLSGRKLILHVFRGHLPTLRCRDPVVH